MTRKLALAVACAALALPAAAHAAAKPQRFLATFTGTQTTTWRAPQATAPVGRCSTVSRQAAGKEETRVASKPTRVTLMPAPGGFSLVYGSPKRQWQGIRATGHVRRSDTAREDYTAGACETTAFEDVERDESCGSRPTWFVRVAGNGRKAQPTLLDPGLHDIDLEDCRVVLPEGATSIFTAAAARLTSDVLFDLQDPGAEQIVVTGRRTFTEDGVPLAPYADVTARTTVRWTLKLRRAR